MRKSFQGNQKLLSASNDGAMMKQVIATHDVGGLDEVDVKPVLLIIEDIFRQATLDNVLTGRNQPAYTLEDKTSLAGFDGILEALAYTIRKIGCEISCKCSGGGDAHSTTMVIFSTLSSCPWEAKVVIALAAFAMNYGEFWLVTRLQTTNQLARSIALLKQVPSLIEHANSMKPQFDALNQLIKAMVDVTKCIVMFKELQPQYISADTPPLSTAMAHVPAAAYWCIRSVVACASQAARHKYVMSTTDAWELSSLAHKIGSIHEHLQKQLILCYQHIDEKRRVEAYQNLMSLFQTIHLDNIKILRELIYAKDDQPPLFDGSTRTKVNVESLRRKHVLLLISTLDLSHDEIATLGHMYMESRKGAESYYEVVWLPIVDSSASLIEEDPQYHHHSTFAELQSIMPWHSVSHPSIIESTTIKYIKEVWQFSKKAILVSLDPQGKVQCVNALHMLRIWGNAAFPFSNDKEADLWKAELWRLELLVDGIDMNPLQWARQGRIVCLYGGEDIEWIRKFTSTMRAVASAIGAALEMVYVGKSNPKERVRRIISVIETEQISHSWDDLTSIWFFWARMESMFYSKMKLGCTIETDRIMKEVMTLLSFDGSDHGWAVFCEGTNDDHMVSAKGDLALLTMLEFEKWQEEAVNAGFVFAMKNHLQLLHTPHHCNHLILPGFESGIPEKVVCSDCGRPMEKFIMYRCCDD